MMTRPPNEDLAAALKGPNFSDREDGNLGCLDFESLSKKADVFFSPQSRGQTAAVFVSLLIFSNFINGFDDITAR
jgi:hypothetical protein